MIKAIGLGAGGNSRPVLDALAQGGTAQIIGLLDADASRHGTMVDDVAILGGDDMLAGLAAKGVTHFFVGLGGGGMAPFSGRLRQSVSERARAFGLAPLGVLHPRAIVSSRAILGAGVTVLAGAVVNAGAEIGDGALVNTGAIVEHDCRIGAYAHIATGAVLAGAVCVGALAHVGAGATIRQGVIIGDGAVVGAGAVVVKDVAAGAVVKGVPAR